MKDDSLFLDYEQTNELIRMLTDIRFKLLAAVPAASAAIISLVAEKPNQTAALVVGLFGLMVTLPLVSTNSGTVSFMMPQFTGRKAWKAN
ncbi:MAG: hypothetical protein H0V54_13380 [Chthoniobacterales bacterium]|nr:hypothetical protein [Chthoniobacterales bacterium]